MTTPQMVVFPWVTLKEPVTICGVEILPRAVAIERGGRLAENIAASTSYFYDHRIEGAPYIGHPLGLVPVKPSIVFLDETTTQERVEVASLVWTFSTIFGNGPFTYANSTTFQHYYQNLGGEAGVAARRTRRMHGTKLDGSLSMNVLDVRPHWCGDYHDPDGDMLSLLESIIDRNDAVYIREALGALWLATKDDDTEPAAAEHAHYARAVERLLHRLGQSGDRDRLQRDLANTLLIPLLAVTGQPVRILQVRDAVRNQRNQFWHPESSKSAKHPFEKQIKVHPNLIAFRAISALIVASIRNLVGSALADCLEVYPQAVEDWIEDIKEDDVRSSEEASELGRLWSSGLFRMRVARAYSQQGLPTPA